MNSVLLFLILATQLGLGYLLRNILKEIKINKSILELSDQLRKKTDALEQAIEQQQRKK